MFSFIKNISEKKFKFIYSFFKPLQRKYCYTREALKLKQDQRPYVLSTLLRPRKTTSQIRNKHLYNT